MEMNIGVILLFYILDEPDKAVIINEDSVSDTPDDQYGLSTSDYIDKVAEDNEIEEILENEKSLFYFDILEKVNLKRKFDEASEGDEIKVYFIDLYLVDNTKFEETSRNCKTICN